MAQADLIKTTGKQISLYQKLGISAMTYLHLPLAIDHNGIKLSKQNRAPPIDNAKRAHQWKLHLLS